MKRSRCAACAVAVLWLLVIFCGCTGRELYERLAVRTMGIDTDSGGVRLTVLTSEEGELFTSVGETIEAALAGLEQASGRKPFYAQCDTVVFGASCSEDELADFVDFLARSYLFRPAVGLCKASGSAENLLKEFPTIHESEQVELVEVYNEAASRRWRDAIFTERKE